MRLSETSACVMDVRREFDVMQAKVAASLPTNTRHYVEIDRWSRQLYAKLEALVLGGMPRDIPGVSVPANWWEHLKADLKGKFPRALRRLEPRYAVIREPQRIYARVCPHLEIPERGEHVTFLLGDDRGNT